MQFFKNNLLFKVIVSILLGIGIGQFTSAEVVRIFLTINNLFSEFLNFIIPLIIIGLVIPAIGNIGGNATKLVVATAALAYGSTIFAGFGTFGISMAVFPNLLENQTAQSLAVQTTKLEPYFSITIPPMVDIISALLFSFIIGIGLTKIKNTTLLVVSQEFELIINKVIQKIIIPFLPVFIFGIFLNMSFSGEVFIVLKVFIKIILVIFAMHLGLLIVQFLIAGIISKRNPITALKTMLPAYFTALGTQSSAATIPVTLQQGLKLGLSEQVIKMTIPLCATIHLAGSTMKIVACAVALMLIQGIDIDVFTFSGFILMLGIAMVAAPGVPGGAIMAALGILSSILGFDEKSLALMISLYIAMDSFGTACNVTGDGALAIILDKFFNNKSIQ